MRDNGLLQCANSFVALQDTLGGRAHMALIICCSPDASDASETVSSLRFGIRAKGIMTSVQVCTAACKLILK